MKWIFFNGEAIRLEGPAAEWFEPETREAIRRCYAILHEHREGVRWFDAWHGRPVTPKRAGEDDILSLELGPCDVGCLVARTGRE